MVILFSVAPLRLGRRAVPCILAMLAAPVSGFAQQFVNEFNSGSAFGGPGNPAAINWDLPSRRVGVFEAYYIDLGQGRVDVGSLSWNVGVASPTVLDLSASGVWQGLSPALGMGGSIDFVNVLTVTLTSPTPFLLVGSLTRLGDANAALLIEPTTGAISGVQTGPSGELRFSATSVPQGLSVTGLLSAGDYRITLNAGVRGAQAQSFTHALTLTIPSPGAVTFATIGACACLRRRRSNVH